MLFEQDKRSLDAIIGNNIRLERVARKLKIGELSSMLGISQSHLGLIERGHRGANSVNLMKLSKIFDMKIDEFFVPYSAKRDSASNNSDTPANTSRKKIQTMIACADDSMLELIAHTIKGITKFTKN